MGVIRFNGISSADFGCTIQHRPNHTRGSRRGELIEVPGRNGAAVLEDGSFTTYKQEYVMAFKEGDTMPPYKRAAQVAEWLLGSRGFCRLEDDFEPNVYRMARYAGVLNIEQVADKYGQVVLEFECQPQRFLKSGESAVQITSTTNGNVTERSVIIDPIPQSADKARLTLLQKETLTYARGNLYTDVDGDYTYADMQEVKDPGDFEYTNVMDSSSARYIAGSRYSMNSHAFVDSENPECDCVVVPVPQNNETVRIRIKNATFSNWNTVYGGTTNNAFNKDYGRNPVNPSAPQDEYGDYYFDFQNDRSSFIVFNINPMSNPSSLIVTVNEPIIKINADGLTRYVGELALNDSNMLGVLKSNVTFPGSNVISATVEILNGETIVYSFDFNADGITLENLTNNEARPLIKATGIPSSPPSPVTQTLTMRDGMYISRGGTILRATSPEGMVYDKVSNPVSVSGYAYAYITGSGYVFLDSNGKTRSGSFVPSVSGNVQNKKVIIPAWAATICVATSRTNQSAALQFMAAYTAGAAVATVNGTTINLDFSVHDTIYLDCDLHDAYYDDGSSANAAVSFASTLTDYPTFPGLLPGDNTISVSSENATSFEIVPRWWVL